MNKDNIEKMKKIILHLHLDGSLRPETVREWLAEDGEKLSSEEVKARLMVDKDCKNLNEYLEKFDIPSKVLQNAERIERATAELYEDLSKQNVIYAEVRFAPSKHLEKGLSYDEVVKAAIKGLENAKQNYNIDGKMVARKGGYVVYIKEGEGIVDVLNVMEAHVSLMEMENVRILKGMSNYYNRQVNCETANIKKTVATSVRQIDDIDFIIQNKGIDYLPEKLQDIAWVRKENPDASLQELGEMLDPPLGKSGVNHRLRKICQIAQELRG